jgi:phage gp29-like protein
MLYDYLNRPVKTRELTREQAAPTLTGVRSIWTDTVASGLTPQRLATLLMAAADGDHHAYLTLAEEMEERDLHYAAELGKRKLAVSRLPITVESATDSARDKELAEAVRTLIKGGGFRALLKDLLDAIGKGFSVVEILWATGSQWRPQRYEWRDPRFFQFDQVSRREIRLRDELDGFNGLELAPYKYLTHIHHGKSGIPIRGGIARLAAWAFMCKGYAVKDWLAFAEVFGMPLRLGKYGPSAKDEEIRILKMAVANLGIDAAAVFPESMQVELVEAGNKGGSADFFERLANYLDKQISLGILGQTASSSGTPGKLGNEDLQAEVRDDIRDDDAEGLEETLNRDLVRPFIDLNFGPQENYPEIQLRAIPPEDVAALVAAVEKLVPFGFQVEQSVMRDKLGLPDPDPKAKPEDLLRPAGAQNQSKLDEETAEAPPEKQLPPHTARNSQQTEPDEQLAIDAMIASITDAALQGQADAILAGLLKQITEGADYTEVMAWLAEAEPTMDSSAMEALLGRALFIAETWGRINGGRD